MQSGTRCDSTVLAHGLADELFDQKLNARISHDLQQHRPASALHKVSVFNRDAAAASRWRFSLHHRVPPGTTMITRRIRDPAGPQGLFSFACDNQIMLCIV